MSFFQEFKSFAMRGSVVDLAVGVVIGGAFNTIVNSLVGDIVMPLLGVLTGGINFSGLKLTVGEASIAYGKFIQASLSFLVVAFALFLVVKAMNVLRREEAGVPAKDIAPTDTVQLLSEIRDLLKNPPKYSEK